LTDTTGLRSPQSSGARGDVAFGDEQDSADTASAHVIDDFFSMARVIDSFAVYSMVRSTINTPGLHRPEEIN
jgi:hypothetical protein